MYCLPNPNFSANPVCQGDVTSFVDESVPGTHPSGPIVAWNWNMGAPGTYVNGTSSSSQNPEYIFNSCGPHNVTLEVTDTNGCTESINITIDVWCNPTADFSANPECFDDQPVLFSDNSTNGSGNVNQWNWNMGGTGTYVNGTSSSSQNPEYIYQDCGIYSVTLIVTDDNGCKDTIIKRVEVHCEPTNFNYTPDCVGNPTVFTDASYSDTTITTWIWNMGGTGNYVGGTNANSPNPQYEYDDCGLLCDFNYYRR